MHTFICKFYFWYFNAITYISINSRPCCITEWHLCLVLSHLCRYQGNTYLSNLCRYLGNIYLSNLCRYLGNTYLSNLCRYLGNTYLSNLCRYLGNTYRSNLCRYLGNTYRSNLCRYLGNTYRSNLYIVDLGCAVFVCTYYWSSSLNTHFITSLSCSSHLWSIGLVWSNFPGFISSMLWTSVHLYLPLEGTA